MNRIAHTHPTMSLRGLRARVRLWVESASFRHARERMRCWATHRRMWKFWRHVRSRQGKVEAMWYCPACDTEFVFHRE